MVVVIFFSFLFLSFFVGSHVALKKKLPVLHFRALEINFVSKKKKKKKSPEIMEFQKENFRFYRFVRMKLGDHENTPGIVMCVPIRNNLLI